MLESCGYKTILEARNGQEALKVLDQEKSKVRLIIADVEMPYMTGFELLAKVSERPILDGAGFLMITSDIADSRLADIRREHPRLDHWLIKPFRSKTLSEAILTAHENRQKHKGRLLGILSPEALSAARAALSENRGNSHWEAIDGVMRLEELEAHFSGPEGRRTGAILIEPPVYQSLGQDWLSPFKKTPLGTQTPVVCLGREPRVVSPLRLHAHLFRAFPSLSSDWSELFRDLSRRALNAWRMEQASALFKAALQKKDRPEIRKLAQEMLSLDPVSSEALLACADAEENAGETAQALSHYLASLESNPCSPRAYLRLFELLPRGELERRREIALQASSYCPANIDVLLGAARVQWESKDPRSAMATLEAILKINPKHEAARELQLQVERGLSG